MSEQFEYLVEWLQPGEFDEFTRQTRLAGMLIDNDKRGAHGQYREEAAMMCPKCVQARREPRMILNVYVAPGGDRLIYFPPRIRSGGPDGSPSARVPSTARTYPTLSTGLDVAACRSCQQHYVVTAEFEGKWRLYVFAVESSTFGAVSETGAPCVTHKIRRTENLERLKQIRVERGRHERP